MTDPFEQLSAPVEPRSPRPAFARALRAQVVAALGLDPADLDPAEALPTIDLPPRSRTVSTSPTASPAATGPGVTTSRPDVGAAPVLVPYLAVAGAAAAIDWYAEVFGAVEVLRVVGDDGRLGHAEVSVGSARIMLSDEYPEYGVHSPTSLGGSATTLHLTVADVDAVYARAVEAGATAVTEPADQPHGARHGNLVDPFGHRWMISQDVEDLSIAEYAERSQGSGFEVTAGAPRSRGAGPTQESGGIWAAVFYEDGLAAIREAVEVFGFEEHVVVLAEDQTTIVHSELRWPEGGIVQFGTYDPANPYCTPPGTQTLYCITTDPLAVWERCQAAGLEVDRPPYEPHYDPGGTGFVVKDREGNHWSFGSYAGGATG